MNQPKQNRLSQVKEDIRMRLDIVTVVERYVALKQTGSSYKGLCPFHKEKSPSFNVSPDKDIFHCFGCGKGGDVFTFLMEIEGVSFMDALSLAGREVGISVEQSDEQRQYNSEQTVNRQVAFAANGHAVNYFYEQMKLSTEAINYFKGRGLSGETVRDFRLGFAPDSWDGLIAYLHKNGVSPQNATLSGLAVASNRGGKPYDRFRKRIIFPIMDMQGRAVAFGGRTMDPDGIPKYLNSPETVLYQKNRVFYGLYQARQDIREKGSVIIVEGYMDMLSLYQAGIKNAVATCGTAMTMEHGHNLRRITGRVYLVFDGDSAGVKAARRATENLFPLELDVRVALLPSGEDPDTLIKAKGADGFNELLNESVAASDFYVAQLEIECDTTTPQGRSKVVQKLATLLGKLENPIILGDYIRQYSMRFGVDEVLFRQLIQKDTDVNSAGYDTNTGAREGQLEQLLASEEGSLVHLLISNADKVFEWKDKISLEIFSEPLFRKVYSLILERDGDTSALINDASDPTLRDLISLLLIRETNDHSDQIEHKVKKLQSGILARKRAMITQKLAATQDFAQKQKLLAELTLLTTQNGEK